MPKGRKASKEQNSVLLDERKQQRFVVPEGEIRSFVDSLNVLDINTVAARFQVVADLTSDAFEERRDQLRKSDLSLIKQVADEDNDEHYRRIMKSIIAGVEQGRFGINASHLTARRVVELAFRWSRDYFYALHSYRRSLSRLRLLNQPCQVAEAADHSSRG
jgi:hypothetical protein